MKHIIRYILLHTLLSILSTDSFAQKAINLRTDTVKWEYGNAENKSRSEAMAISGHLISYGDKGFTWIQNGTETKYSIIVKSVKGEWLDTNEEGELVFQAECEGIEGTIRIFRDMQDMSIHLDFTQQDKLTPNIILQVNSYSKI